MRRRIKQCSTTRRRSFGRVHVGSRRSHGGTSSDSYRSTRGTEGEEPRAVLLSRSEWKRRVSAHRRRICSVLGGDTEDMRLRTNRDPIFNFLFNYYRFKPRILKEYTPGMGVALMASNGNGEYEKSGSKSLNSWFVDENGSSICSHASVESTIVESNRVAAVISPKWLLADSRRIQRFERVAYILRSVASRPPTFGCFNMHEWAMVYDGGVGGGETSTRPSYFQKHLPLRVPQKTVDEMVEKHFRCTHFDATRHFPRQALSFNRVGPLTPDNRADYEQPGCLHVTLDLFKWALRLHPFAPSEILVDALELAVDARVVDMRASPYDLTAMAHNAEPSSERGDEAASGLDAIRAIEMETAAGREEYRCVTKRLSDRAKPIREALLAYAEKALRSSSVASV